MRGGYQIIDLSTATIGFESIISDVYQTIKHFDGKPVFIITPNTSGVFAEFTENNGMYIGAYIGSNSHLYTVSIISSNRVTIIDKGPAGGGGTSNYNELSNKPAIAGITLSGDKPLSDFGIQGALIAGSNISIDANNEISANVDSIAASSVTYDNTSSGMTADNVQKAITELTSNEWGPYILFDTNYQYSSYRKSYKYCNVVLTHISANTSGQRQQATVPAYYDSLNIFTLPEGYRPLTALSFVSPILEPLSSKGKSVIVEIGSNGVIKLENPYDDALVVSQYVVQAMFPIR